MSMQARIGLFVFEMDNERLYLSLFLAIIACNDKSKSEFELMNIPLKVTV